MPPMPIVLRYSFLCLFARVIILKKCVHLDLDGGEVMANQEEEEMSI